MTFAPVFQRPFPATFDRRAAAAAEAFYTITYNAGTPYTFINAGSGASIDNLTAGAFTVEAWVRKLGTGQSSQGAICAKGQGANGFWLYTTGSGGGNVRCEIFAATTGASTYTANATLLVDGNWHHVAMCYDDTGSRKAEIFVDGVKPSYTTYTAAVGAVVPDAAYNLSVGAIYQGSLFNWNGYIGWMRISNVVRYTSNFSPVPKCTPPATDANTLLLYRLTEGIGTAIADTSANANNGTLANGAWNAC